MAGFGFGQILTTGILASLTLITTRHWGDVTSQSIRHSVHSIYCNRKGGNATKDFDMNGCLEEERKWVEVVIAIILTIILVGFSYYVHARYHKKDTQGPEKPMGR